MTYTRNNIEAIARVFSMLEGLPEPLVADDKAYHLSEASLVYNGELIGKFTNEGEYWLYEETE